MPLSLLIVIALSLEIRVTASIRYSFSVIIICFSTLLILRLHFFTEYARNTGNTCTLKTRFSSYFFQDL